MEQLPPRELYNPTPEERERAEAMMPEELKAERIAENENYDREVNDIIATIYERHGNRLSEMNDAEQYDWWAMEEEATVGPSEEAKLKLKNFLERLDSAGK